MREVKQQHPIPMYSSHGESRQDGVYWVEPNTDKQTGEIINRESWLCSPLQVIGTGRDDKDQFLILRWQAWGSDSETTQAIRWPTLASVKDGERSKLVA